MEDLFDYLIVDRIVGRICQLNQYITPGVVNRG